MIIKNDFRFQTDLDLFLRIILIFWHADDVTDGIQWRPGSISQKSLGLKIFKSVLG